METLHDLLTEELQDIYSAEKQIVKALPRMVKGAGSEALKDALNDHLEETREQVTRLEQVFQSVGVTARTKHCKGMEGLLDEGAQGLEENKENTLRDLQIIAAAQRVEHYEISAYGSARAIAEQMGLEDVVELLSATIDEESGADEKLTEVALTLYAEVGTNGMAGEKTQESERPPAKSRARSETSSKKPMAKTGSR
ncbi:MAG: ferritin-like domain-containing protein [Acidobacteria bacterium]|nr:ferritin-like domain-containing protein [Acidobacteriota bacterium]